MESRRTTFLWYCAYALGIPALISLIVFLSDYTSFIPEEYKSRIGSNQCFIRWSTTRIEELIYVYLPISFLLAINTFFYTITAHKIYQVQKETSIVKSDNNARHGRDDMDRAR